MCRTHEDFRKDPGTFRITVSQGGGAMRHAREDLRKDLEVVTAAGLQIVMALR
jgi:hypothetical protein